MALMGCVIASLLVILSPASDPFCLPFHLQCLLILPSTFLELPSDAYFQVAVHKMVLPTGLRRILVTCEWSLESMCELELLL